MLYLVGLIWARLAGYTVVLPVTFPACGLFWYKIRAQERQNKIRLKSRLTYGSPMTAKELDSEVNVVQGCFMEGDNSILSVFSWELLQAKLQHK